MSELPVWFSGGKDAKRTQNARSRSQEARYAAQRGGKRQPGSGARPGAPGDVRSENELTEMKFTDAKSYTLKVSDLQKILRQALSQGREPEFVIDFEKYGIRAVIQVETL